MDMYNIVKNGELNNKVVIYRLSNRAESNL